ncbi:MAG: lamin tail domain-containing protein [Candidatus Pacebacteria bacterium]|nr:lamin tail domain-containing protein [Candidatus Paceibacterota bacterium]
MEIKKSLKFALFSLALSILSPVFCYGYANETTHPALTKETVELFNNYYPELELTDNQKVFVEEGSKNEDAPEIRCLNHFYDPVYNVGLLNVNFTAKNWSQNTRAQAGFNLANVGIIKDYFSANTDYSWDRAIYDYVYGDKNRALEALGHNLHLIQDMSVPPHVRNDQHATDPSPYETFTKDFNVDNIYDISGVLISENKKPVVAGNLNDYFYKLASFTNKNFFSESTIFSNRYTSPVGNDICNIENFIGNKIGDECYKLIYKDVSFWLGKVNSISYRFDNDDIVLTDYWNILSKQAVLHGAGVIKLFFDDVEKEKQTHALYDLNKSFAEKTKDSLVGIGEKIAKTVYGVVNSGQYNSQNLAGNVGNLAQLNNNQQNQNQSEENEQPVDNNVDNELAERGRENTDVDNSGIIFGENEQNENNFEDANNFNTENSQQNQQENQNQPPQNQFNLVSPGFGGGAPIVTSNSGNDNEDSDDNNNDNNSDNDDNTNDNTSEAQETNTEIINPPIITSPTNNQKFNQNSITFTGTASSTNIVYSDFSETIKTITDTNENWQLILEDFEQGTTTINFFAVNNSQTATSSPTTIEIFVDSQAPTTNLFVKECENSLSNSKQVCLLAVKNITINPEWSFSDGEDFSHFVLNQNGAISTTTATTTTIEISGNQNYRLTVSAVDNMGNVSEEAEQIIQINNAPVVINEIAWAGTSSDTYNDEWIELYNNTDEEISLENWILYAEDKEPHIKLSKSIPAKGYYLLERTDDETVSDITADLVYTGNLSNNGEHLFLSFVENGATTTVDEILKANNWNQKGGGRSYTTMERYDTNIAGTDWDNWGGSMNKLLINGKNADGGDIFGTPKQRNSSTYLINKSYVLSQDKTLIKENSPYFIGDTGFEIKEGAVLTLEDGVVIKFSPHGSPSLVVNGTIKAKGTSENPVVFTSFYDDEYGGDMNKDGLCEPENASSTALCPSAGSWRQILIEDTSKGSSFENTIVRYGGRYSTGQAMKYKGMLTVDGTDVLITDSVFEKSMSRGVQLLNVGSDTEIIGNIFRDNNYVVGSGANYPYGLTLSEGSPLIKDNLFENNGYGLYITGTSAIVDSNIFKNNTENAIFSQGANLFSNNSGSGNGTNGIIILGNITKEGSENTLKKNQIPYVIDFFELIVSASSTLKIDPGVTIKMGNKKFNVYGNIDIGNLEGERVLFTVVSDDSDGFDTDNYPQPENISFGKWNGLYLKDGSTSSIKNAEFRYMRYGVKYENSPINLENVVFKNNDTAIYADLGAVIQKAENIVFEGNNATSTIPLY